MAEKPAPTPKQIAALRALVAHGYDKKNFSPAEFADVVWPDSPGHKVRTNGAWGLAGTTGIYMAAGTQISRLCKLGAVRVAVAGEGYMRYLVTPTGVRLASDAEAGARRG